MKLTYGKPNIGLNADWCVNAWHFGPGRPANMISGDVYVLDLETDLEGAPASYQVVRRFEPREEGAKSPTAEERTAELYIAYEMGSFVEKLKTFTDPEDSAMPRTALRRAFAYAQALADNL